MRRLLFTLVTIVVAYTFVSAQTQQAYSTKTSEKKAGEKIVIKFIETSDVHGAIFPFDYKNNQTTNHSLAQVSAYVQKQRATNNQEVVLLDNGDILQGQPIVYYYNFDKDAPHVCATVMNYMKYDAGAIGNHDLEPGHETYDQIAQDFKFPWLSANILIKGTDKTYFKPYTVVNRKGVKIAILGMCTPGVPNWLPEKIWSGMEFADMIETAKKWVPIIQKKEQPDLLVGLFHAGTDFTEDGYSKDSKKNPNGSLLVAEQVPGFDIIFTGHDHKNHADEVINSKGEKVYVIGPNSAANFVGTATATLTYNTNTKTYDKTIVPKFKELKNYSVDRAFESKFSYINTETKKYFAAPVGTFAQEISTRDAMFGDSEFVDLIHTIQLELTGADISFAAPLSHDAKIEKGKVYVRNMFNLYKYENLLFTLELTGQEIRDFLEYSYSKWINRMNDENDHLIKFVSDNQGKPKFKKSGNKKNYITVGHYYNYDNAAGINYTVDLKAKEGEMITIQSMADGNSFDLNKKYKCAINSYRASGGGGHLKAAGITDTQARLLESTDKDLRYYMKEWIKKKGTVIPSKDNNWKIIPEEWAKKGKNKSYKLLYPSN